jgi:hypothetical protein
MDKEYIDYYKNQAGGGLPVFEGWQYQRGHGFFGDQRGQGFLGDSARFFFNSILKPAGEYLLPKVVNTGKRIGSDIMNGKDVMDSITKNLGQTAGEILNDGVGRVRKFIQTDNGKRRRRRAKKNATKRIKRGAKSKKFSLAPKKAKRKVGRKKRKSAKKSSKRSRRKVKNNVKNKLSELLK